MTGIIVILGIAALAWGAVLALRGSVLPACAVFLVMACCFSTDFWSFDAAGLTWAADRFFLIGLVGLFALQILVHRTDHKPIGAAEATLGAFLLLVAVSTFTHDWRTLGPDKVPVLMHLVNGYSIPATVFLIAREVALTKRTVRSVQIVLAGFGVYLAVTALLEIAGLWSLVFPRHIADPKVGIHFGRARGPMVQSAQLGTFLIACCTATWVWVAFGRERNSRRNGAALVAVATIPLYLAAVFATYTRSVWMGMGLATAIVVGLTFPRRARAVALSGMAAAVVLVLALKGSDLVSLKRETSGAVTRESTYMRASFAYVSWEMFKDHPLTGVGFSQFPRHSPFYLSDRDNELHLEAIRGYIHHNTFLSVLVELGIAGLVLFVMLLVAWVRNAWLLWADRGAPAWMRGHALLMLTCFGPYFCQLLFREVSYSPQENSLIFMLAGITCGLRAMRVRETTPAAVPASLRNQPLGASPRFST